MRAEIEAGRISEADAAPLFAAEAAAKTAEGNARAYQATAACLIAGGRDVCVLDRAQHGEEVTRQELRS